MKTLRSKRNSSKKNSRWCSNYSKKINELFLNTDGSIRSRCELIEKFVDHDLEENRWKTLNEIQISLNAAVSR